MRSLDSLLIDKLYHTFRSPMRGNTVEDFPLPRRSPSPTTIPRFPKRQLQVHIAVFQLKFRQVDHNCVGVLCYHRFTVDFIKIDPLRNFMHRNTSPHPLSPPELRRYSGPSETSLKHGWNDIDEKFQPPSIGSGRGYQGSGKDRHNPPPQIYRIPLLRYVY